MMRFRCLDWAACWLDSGVFSHYPPQRNEVSWSSRPPGRSKRMQRVSVIQQKSVRFSWGSRMEQAFLGRESGPLDARVSSCGLDQGSHTHYCHPALEPLGRRASQYDFLLES